MHKSFSTLEDLFSYIKEDKEWQGVNSGQHNRYPIRFVLFDNFADFNEFVVNRPDGIFKYPLDSLLEREYHYSQRKRLRLKQALGQRREKSFCEFQHLILSTG